MIDIITPTECYMAFNYATSIEEKLNLVLKTKDPEVCYNLAFLFYKNKECLNKLSEVILESLNDYYIDRFYNNYDFDKTKYDSYFRNLLFM